MWAVVQLFAGAVNSGVTTDEPIHVDRASSWVEDGWYVPAVLLNDEGRPDPLSDFSSPYVYGPAYSALAHGANVLVGNESVGEISGSAAAYDVRHLTVAALALLAVLAVGAGVWRLTDSARFGLWAAAALMAVPAWTGHAFFNPKDVPAAVGYTLVTVALLVALRGCEDALGGKRGRLLIGGLLAGGVFIGVGTRLAMWLPLILSIAVYASIRLGQRRLGGLVRSDGADGAVAVGAALGFAAIALVYPKAAAAPFDLLLESVSGATEFPYTGFTLTAGQLLSEQPPWWYLPLWIAASLPLLLGVLALGAVRGICGFIRQVRKGPDGLRGIWTRPELGLAFVFLQVLLLPAASILSGATMYNGVRQHLYVLPALAILAGFGAQRLWAWARARSIAPLARRALAAGLALALIVPMAEQTLLFPYNYAYVNPLAGIGGVEDRWESDYWFASGPEALSRVPAGAALVCSDFLLLPGQADGELELESCSEAQLAPFASKRGTAVAERWRGDHDAVWMIARKRADNHPPSYCEPADDVSRWLRGERVTMSLVLRCDPAAIDAG